MALLLNAQQSAIHKTGHPSKQIVIHLKLLIFVLSSNTGYICNTGISYMNTGLTNVINTNIDCQQKNFNIGYILYEHRFNQSCKNNNKVIYILLQAI